MESVLVENIPSQIPDKIDQLLWLSDSFEDLNYLIIELKRRIIALEHGEPDTIISSERVETIFEIVKLKGSIKTRQVKYVLGVKQNHQAIRAMKKTARIHSANVFLVQSRHGNKEYSLNMRDMSEDHESSK